MVLAQEGNVRPRQEGARRDRERECAAQYGQLPVDGRVLRALALSPGDVPADVRRRDRGHASPAEERREVQPQVTLHVHERPLPLHPVVVEDLPDGGAERQADELRRDGHAAGGRAADRFRRVSGTGSPPCRPESRIARGRSDPGSAV